MTTEFSNCQLEIDHERGVIYVHGPNGQTLLRISSLPKPIPKLFQVIDDGTTNRMLDITHMHGCDWAKERG